MTPHQIDPTVVSHMDEQMVAVGRMRTADGWTDKAGGGGLIRYSFGSLALSLSLSLSLSPPCRRLGRAVFSVPAEVTKGITAVNINLIEWPWPLDRIEWNQSRG